MTIQHFALTILLITLCSCGSQNNPLNPQISESTSPAVKPVEFTQRSATQTTSIIDRLNLTADQREALKEIQKQFAADLQAAKQQTLYHTDYNDLLTEFENAFVQILSAEQHNQYEAMKTQTILIVEELTRIRV